MTNEVRDATQPWSHEVELKQLNGGNPAKVVIRAGITTLVGPNGSGKTRALRALKDAFTTSRTSNRSDRKIYFLAAGRSSPLENYRASLNHPDSISDEDAAVGHISYMKSWWQIESVTGALLTLSSRPDLRLKIEARLQQLLDRSVQLSWSQTGLSIHFRPISGGPAYAANDEASGVLQLVALLAAIHNDDINILIIDEPEISLHPQHQAFLLEEMESVAGDPADPSKKLIIIATHSGIMLPLRKVDELPSILFFSSIDNSPVQIAPDADILKRGKLATLVSRLSTSHRMAVFADRVLMVEGPSDEIIAVQLARRLGLRMLARNAQIVPVAGKGEFIEAAKLFGLMNKQVAMLADLDALADDNKLVRYFSDLPGAVGVANSIGRRNLADLDKDLRDALEEWMLRHHEVVVAVALDYPDWSSRDAAGISTRRVTLARLLTEPARFGGKAGEEALALRERYEILLAALSRVGCFFLRRGAVENYYDRKPDAFGKPDLALHEASKFVEKDVKELKNCYADLVGPLSHVAPKQLVDEDLLLRPKLGAVLSAAFLEMNSQTTDDQLNSIAAATLGSDAQIFKLSNRTKDGDYRLEVEITSTLFKRATFPFEISYTENSNLVVPAKLPGTTEE